MTTQEIIARSLWNDGNRRIGFRSWETVSDAYMNEAKNVLVSLSENGYKVVPV